MLHLGIILWYRADFQKLVFSSVAVQTKKTAELISREAKSGDGAKLSSARNSANQPVMSQNVGQVAKSTGTNNVTRPSQPSSVPVEQNNEQTPQPMPILHTQDKDEDEKKVRLSHYAERIYLRIRFKFHSPFCDKITINHSDYICEEIIEYL